QYPVHSKISLLPHAGWFRFGVIVQDLYNRSMRNQISFNDHNFVSIDAAEDGPDQLLQIRNKLFSGIKLGRLVIECDGKIFTLDFVRAFTRNFKVKRLNLLSQSEEALENSLKLLSGFSGSPCTF
ncbi:hypothetical protein PMAYCL1PPCAC_25791, partial [Pristionchus mayeri]